MSLTSLCTAIKYGNVEEVRTQLKEGADPNGQTQDWNKTRPLILAAASGHRDIMQALLACPQLDINLPDGLFGNTALMDASHNGNTDVVKQLIQDKRFNRVSTNLLSRPNKLHFRTDVNFRTERSGMTALMQVRTSNFH